MKLQAILPAILFAAISSLSVGAYAADMDKGAADAQADKAATKKMQPHSHMQEKTGVAPKATAAAADETADKVKSDKPKAGKDKAKHYHPRDGK